jgi:hypothetical protein
LSKNDNFSGENIYKIITSVPGVDLMQPFRPKFNDKTQLGQF